MVHCKSVTATAPGHTYVQWIVAIVANTVMLNYGLLCGWLSPMLKILQSENSPTGPLSDDTISWIVSAQCISAMLAVPIYIYIADAYGRKASIIATLIPQLLCWGLKLFYPTALGLYIARTCSGIASVGCFTAIPIYVREISQDNIRGTLGSLLMMSQNIGIFIMYAMGAYLDYFVILWIVILCPVITLVSMLSIPESPAYLVKIGKLDKAAEALSRLRGLNTNDKSIQNEINSLVSEDRNAKSLPEISLKTIFQNKAWRRGFVLMLAIIGIQNTNGNYTIVNYAASILSACGVTFNPELQTLSFPAVTTLGALLSMNCVERLGRKPVLVCSLAAIALAFGALASWLLALSHGAAPSSMSVLCVLLAVFAYGLGLSPVPHIIMTDIFNFQMRAKAMGYLMMFCNLMSFVQVIMFTPMSNSWGMHVAFYFFAGVNLLGVLITLVFLPETRGKTVEEIENILEGKQKTREIVSGENCKGEESRNLNDVLENKTSLAV